MSEALDQLVDLLDLEPIEVNIFRGAQPDEERQRVFGGQVAAQALVAAGRTVDHGDRPLPARVLPAPRRPRVPILYEVDRIRDGRSFTTRRVVAIQHGEAIFNLSASFHVAETGPEHQLPDARGARPRDASDAGPSGWSNAKDRLGDWYDRPHPIDQRYIGSIPWSGQG